MVSKSTWTMYRHVCQAAISVALFTLLHFFNQLNLRPNILANKKCKKGSAVVPSLTPLFSLFLLLLGLPSFGCSSFCLLLVSLHCANVQYFSYSYLI